MDELRFSTLLLGIGADLTQESLLWEALGDRPVIIHALAQLLAVRGTGAITVLVPATRFGVMAGLVGGSEYARVTVVPFPPTAPLAQIVQRGLHASSPTAMVLLQEGTRPFTTPDFVQAVMTRASAGQIVCGATPVRETMKRVDDAGLVVASPDRAQLAMLQAPLAAPRAALLAACEAAPLAGTIFALVMAAGLPLATVPGRTTNGVLRSAEDLALWRWERAGNARP